MWSEASAARLSGMRLTAAAWILGALVTAGILFTPLLAFGYRDPAIRLLLDAMDAGAALLVAFLVYGRFLRRRRLQDLFLVQGLVLLAVAGLVLTHVTQGLGSLAPGTLDIWLPLSVRLSGAVLIVAAAFAGDRRVTDLAWRRVALLGPLALLLLAAAALWTAAPVLPVALDPDYVPGTAAHPILTGHPVLLAAQAIGAVCFLSASVSFATQAEQNEDDEILRWLGPACALGGFARINYFLFPSVYSDWLYTGDLLRTGCYVLLLVAAVREIERFWSAQAHEAVLEDRHRLARELHDGVMQELVYIRSESHSIPDEAPSRSRIQSAVDRALGEARAAVQALSGTGGQPLPVLLEQAAAETTHRYGARVQVSVSEQVDADADQTHSIMRITREAMSNAVRHGGARELRVALTTSEGRSRLSIADDGRGFDVPRTTGTSTGYGLTSMRDRARSLPGSLRVQSTPGEGCEVTVEW
jgi:signal transduction histidine kinase